MRSACEQPVLLVSCLQLAEGRGPRQRGTPAPQGPVAPGGPKPQSPRGYGDEDSASPPGGCGGLPEEVIPWDAPAPPR